MKLKITKVPFIDKKGFAIGEELIIENCPKVLAKVNVRKSCSKCPAKQKLSYINMEVDCKLAK